MNFKYFQQENGKFLSLLVYEIMYLRRNKDLENALAINRIFLNFLQDDKEGHFLHYIIFAISYHKSNF